MDEYTVAWMTACPVRVPLDDYSAVSGSYFALGGQVQLGPLPDWLGTGEVADFVRQKYGDRTADFSRLALVVDYRAGPLGDPVEPGSKTSKQDRAYDAISLTNLSMWLTHPAQIGFELVVHAQELGDRWTYRHIFRTNRLVPLEVHSNERLTVDDLAEAAGLSEMLAGLQRTGRVWTAVRYLWQALKQDWWEGRFLLLWTAIETLFGPDNPGETTYRLSQRVALFLAASKDEAAGLVRDLRRGYGWRSRVVHGAPLNKLQPELSRDIIEGVELTLRRAVLKIVTDDSLVGVFNGESREIFLEDLVLSWGYTPTPT